jgi:hypothetical protein
MKKSKIYKVNRRKSRASRKAACPVYYVQRTAMCWLSKRMEAESC